jgi:hypothetical protein
MPASKIIFLLVLVFSAFIKVSSKTDTLKTGNAVCIYTRNTCSETINAQQEFSLKKKKLISASSARPTAKEIIIGGILFLLLAVTIVKM